MSLQSGLLTEQICELREKSLRQRKARTPKKAIASWIEDDRLITRPGRALVIILNSRGCSWGLGKGGGCSMCGYSNETTLGITAGDLIEQVQEVIEKFSGKDFQAVKIFNSGSFLDKSEIPLQAQQEILHKISSIPTVSEIIIESRPEFVTSSNLKELKKFLSKEKILEIGIGLETSNDYLRINIINKGFYLVDFKKAAKQAIDENNRVKSYLLFKPPFVTEREAIMDLQQSIIDSLLFGARSISINPLNVQNRTLVYELWKDNLYRPPWFWSLKEVIQNTWKKIEEQKLLEKIDRIVCDPSGAGTQRGVHNCKKCNKDFIKAIKKYSVNQDYSVFDSISCDCFETWKELLIYESASRDQSLLLAENCKNLL